MGGLCGYVVLRRILGGAALQTVASVVFLAATPDAGAQPFALQRLGFSDASYTRADGYQSSTLFALNDQGRAFGYSNRYSGSTLLGYTLWFQSAGAVPTPIGLYDAEHTLPGGGFSITLSEITESGLTRGASARFSGLTNAGQTAWATTTAGTTNKVGFYDAEHTGAAGYKYSETLDLNEAGDLRGESLRYAADGTNLGQTAWVASVSGMTTRVGFTDPAEYQRGDGYRFSSVDFLNAAGGTAGFSNRYADSTYRGQSAWIADRAGSTKRVGFFAGAEFQSTRNYSFSAVEQLTDTGRTRGYSERFSGNADLGRAAWVADVAGATVRVGFVDAEHTRSDGYQASSTGGITDGGLVRGSSQRFAGGTTDLGDTAWVANGSGATFEVGFYGAEFTRADGYQSSLTNAINEAGLVAGVSQRYSGSNSTGQATWRASFFGTSAPVTDRIGFTDAEHTRSDGTQLSQLNAVTQSGNIAGFSRRYAGGSAYLGQTTWLSPASGGTVAVGLTSAEFTRADGWKFSATESLSEAGQITGYSKRYNGGSVDLGQAAWVATVVGGTKRIGVTDARHTAADGTQFSEVSLTTESGYVAGWSNRYDATAGQVGQTAWVFDINTSAVTDFVFSQRTSDGYAFSDVLTLLENGWVLGSYTLFDGTGTDLGLRAFAWNPQQGAFDLGSQVAGGLPAAGFAKLIAAGDGTLAGDIAGKGTPLSNAGEAVYLAQVVPEPSILALLLLALGCFFLIRRRHSISR